MSQLRTTLGMAAASLLVAALVALPATAEGPSGFEPADLPATNPATPPPAPGETAILAPGREDEDDMPTSESQRASALGHLRDVAACVRREGLSLPDPTSDADGVHLAWSGGFRPDVERAIAGCDAAIGGAAASSARSARNVRAHHPRRHRRRRHGASVSQPVCAVHIPCYTMRGSRH